MSEEVCIGLGNGFSLLLGLKASFASYLEGGGNKGCLSLPLAFY